MVDVVLCICDNKTLIVLYVGNKNIRNQLLYYFKAQSVLCLNLAYRPLFSSSSVTNLTHL